MKKKIVIAAAIVVAAILLFPTTRYLKDGGSVEHKAILYSVTNVHQMNPDIESDQPYLTGIIVEAFGLEIYNNVK